VDFGGVAVVASVAEQQGRPDRARCSAGSFLRTTRRSLALYWAWRFDDGLHGRNRQLWSRASANPALQSGWSAMLISLGLLGCGIFTCARGLARKDGTESNCNLALALPQRGPRQWRRTSVVPQAPLVPRVRLDPVTRHDGNLACFTRGANHRSRLIYSAKGGEGGETMKYHALLQVRPEEAGVLVDFTPW